MIQAIETVYAGIKFRSRLEARWAVFMDTLGVTWEYETEGFLLPDGVGYLPDFFVPTIGWIEVKPSYEQDNGKWERFCESHVQEEEFRAFRNETGRIEKLGLGIFGYGGWEYDGSGLEIKGSGY